ncbi:MAG TPA: penicillin-binding protein activator LpoB [Phycisphaerales bacterium]|nr:penicillin-binding protein activator LpoB [Phycisphaerales bacterium]
MNTPRMPKMPSLDQLPPLAPLLSIPLMAAAAFLPGCSPTREVTRVDPNQAIDVNQQFNDVDARQTYQKMVQDCLARPWIDEFSRDHGGRRPVVIVGPVENATQTYIDSKMFSTDIERELINSGRVRFVADKGQRDAVREERIQGHEWSRPETRKQIKAESGADFMLIGRIMQDSPRALDGRSGVQFYKINMEMVNLETNEKAWVDTKEIKKVWRDR